MQTTLMDEDLYKKVQEVIARQQEIDKIFSDNSISPDQPQYADLRKEYSRGNKITSLYTDYSRLEEERLTAEEMMMEDGSDVFDEEIRSTAKQQSEILEKIEDIIYGGSDEENYESFFLEIRPCAGGDEAALFTEVLFQIYYKYLVSKNYTAEMVSSRSNEQGGYKDVIIKAGGEGCYRLLKFESGIHRVQRIPETESSGRIHTSTCSVAVLPCVSLINDVVINPSDIRVDTFRSSGAGGQHVNKTDSAVRITHLPTNIVAECQNDRSQHKNREMALSVLKSRLLERERSLQHQDISEKRRSLIGTGERNERIRTYNYPKKRITDHRINFTSYRLDEVLTGDLDYIIEPLVDEHRKKIRSSKI